MHESAGAGDHGGGGLIPFIKDALIGLIYCCLTNVAILLGMLFGMQFVKERESKAWTVGDRGFIGTAIQAGGRQYQSIVNDGYKYDPERQSTVAFFPAYPLATRAIAAATGLGIETSLILVSNTCLAVAFALLTRYTTLRACPALPQHVGWTLLAFGLWPSTFSFRMAQSESLLIATMLLVLIGINRRWPPISLALVAGLATAARPVGIAVSAAVLWHVLFRSPTRSGARVASIALLAPIACWGLLGYMAYQYARFGNAFAFVQTQEHWTFRMPVAHSTPLEKTWALVTLEPIWGVYQPDSSRFWLLPGTTESIPFNPYFWNPLMFMVMATLVAWGAWRKHLTGPETVLGVSLLAIPYATRSYEMSMVSHGRFAAAVVVAYPLIGRILATLPPPLACVAVAISAIILSYWTALYTTGNALF
jgi:hypothetical protein